MSHVTHVSCRCSLSLDLHEKRPQVYSAMYCHCRYLYTSLALPWVFFLVFVNRDIPLEHTVNHNQSSRGRELITYGLSVNHSRPGPAQYSEPYWPAWAWITPSLFEAENESGTACYRSLLPAALYTIGASYCTPSLNIHSRAKTVQLLVHDASQTRFYWFASGPNGTGYEGERRQRFGPLQCRQISNKNICSYLKHFKEQQAPPPL